MHRLNDRRIVVTLDNSNFSQEVATFHQNILTPLIEQSINHV